MSSDQPEPTKQCKECGEAKPLSAFPQNPNAPDKHRNVCKPCFNAKQRERYMTEDEKKRARRQRRAKLWQEGHTEDVIVEHRAETSVKVQKAVEAGAVKECSICKVVKPVLDFHAHTTKDGFRSECKDCQKAKTRERYQSEAQEARARRKAKMKNWRQRNKEHMQQYGQARHAIRGSDSKLKKLLGLTIWDFVSLKVKMHRNQNGECAICRTPLPEPQKACFDHDHVTGKPRELLCNGCNRCLGFANDSPETLEAAAAYLRKHASKTLKEVRAEYTT